MKTLFLQVLNLSITASWLIFALIMIRLVFRKIPRNVFCILWGLSALRLIFPVQLESIFSLIPSGTTIPTDTGYLVTPTVQINNDLTTQQFNTYAADPAAPYQTLTLWAMQLWCIGIAILLLYAGISYFILHRKVSFSIPLRDNIRLCDGITSPFILGILRPRIYLPSTLEEEQFSHVIAHEQAHLARRDHWWKPLGFLLLAIHWFNPLVWVAYVLFCRDIELACDERVIRSMDADTKKEYSNALLACSIRRRSIAACPLAFGEVGVKQRIKSVLTYKKPTFWMITIAAMLSVIIVLCFMTNPLSMRIRDLTPLEDITLIQLHTATSTHAPDTEEMISLLEDLRLDPNEVSRSLADTRDQTYSIYLDDSGALHFNADCTQVWYEDSVKPSYTYRVRNPKKLLDYILQLPPYDVMISFPYYYNWAGYEAVDYYHLHQTFVADMGDFYINSVQYLPIFQVDSRDELDSFMASLTDPSALTRSRDGLPAFTDTANSFDEAFFRDKSLLIIYFVDNTTSVQHVLNQIYTDDKGFFGVEIVPSYPDGDVNEEMGGWFITIEVDKGFLENRTDYQAWLGARTLP